MQVAKTQERKRLCAPIVRGAAQSQRFIEVFHWWIRPGAGYSEGGEADECQGLTDLVFHLASHRE